MRGTASILRRELVCLVALLGLALIGGCQSVTDGAKAEFSKSNTCPLDRVELRERPELKASDFKKKATPPDEIAADPARLKMWEQKQQQDTARDANDGLGTFVELRGCDQHAYYRCERSQKHPARMDCSDTEDNAGTVKSAF